MLPKGSSKSAAGVSHMSLHISMQGRSEKWIWYVWLNHPKGSMSKWIVQLKRSVTKREPTICVRAQKCSLLANWIVSIHRQVVVLEDEDPLDILETNNQTCEERLAAAKQKLDDIAANILASPNSPFTTNSKHYQPHTP